MTEAKPPKSINEFDYFDDEIEPTEVPLPDEFAQPDLESSLASYRRERRARGRVVFLATAAFLVSVWFLWGFRDWVAYSFSGSRPPLEMGDVTSLRPAEMPHNGFVAISGITEHRGLTQKIVRGLSLNRREFWYFRLLGSRGVFIEVQPDKERYGPATALRIVGRVVDPDREAGYEALLSVYDKKWSPRERPARRVVQVDVEPGDHRLPFIIALLLLSIVAGVNLWVISRFVRHWRSTTGR